MHFVNDTTIFFCGPIFITTMSIVGRLS